MQKPPVRMNEQRRRESEYKTSNGKNNIYLLDQQHAIASNRILTFAGGVNVGIRGDSGVVKKAVCAVRDASREIFVLGDLNGLSGTDKGHRHAQENRKEDSGKAEGLHGLVVEE